MSARVRTGYSAQDVFSNLTLRERLLFAQIVYELGSDNWTEVSKLLVQHPLIDRPKGFFAPQSCQRIYVSLMKEIGVDFVDGVSDDAKRPKAKPNLGLAQKCYKERVAELKAAIADEEEKFSVLAREIQEIQTGKWDESIANEIQKGLAESQRKAKAQASTSPVPVSPSRRTTRSTREELSPLITPANAPTVAPEVEVPSIPDVQPDNVEAVEVVQENENIEQEDTTEPPDEEGPEESAEAMDVEITAPDSMEEDKLETSSNKPSESLEIPNLPRVDEKQAIPREPSPMPDGEAEDVQAAEASDGGATSPAQPTDDVPATPVETEQPESPVEAETRPTRRGERRRVTTRNKAEATSSVSKERKRTREASEPPAEPEGPSNPKRPRASTTTQAPAPSKRFQNIINMLLNTISQHRNGNIFHNPIKPSDAPDYPDIVKRPIDLKAIKGRIKDGTIKDSQDFQRDIYLMYANAMMYNRPNSDIFRMTEEMMTESESHIENHRQTEGFRAP